MSEDLYKALVTFIKSGSANGIESNRGMCLRFVNKLYKEQTSRGPSPAMPGSPQSVLSPDTQKGKE